MGADAIWLYRRRRPGDPSKTTGKLTFGSVKYDHNGKSGLILPFDYQPDDRDQARWLSFDVRVSSQRNPPQTYGAPAVQWQNDSLAPDRAGPLDVLWVLTPEDLERIELDHGVGSTPLAPWTFRVAFEALSSGPGGVVASSGDGTLTIQASQWEVLVGHLGYGLWPGARSELLGPSLDHPSWREAEKRLVRARERLRAGEGRAALEECLGQFEALAGKSYMPEAWKSRWALPPQKREGVVAALAGHCTYLNKIGHHRALHPDPASREHAQMPLDQWEAELAVATSHHYLAYALRLDALVPVPAPAVAVTAPEGE
jgi:hypothetical protein